MRSPYFEKRLLASSFPRHWRGVGGRRRARAALCPGRRVSSPPGVDPGPSNSWSVAVPTRLPGPYIYIYIFIYLFIFIYIYREREHDKAHHNSVLMIVGYAELLA